MPKNRRQTQKKRTKRRSQRQITRIDALPNDVLLEIFDFHTKMYPSDDASGEIGAWKSLVHVCRRWRGLVFDSPRRLNLKIRCTPETSPKDTLDVWPALPLLVEGGMSFSLGSSSLKNVITALGQSNRVCKVALRDLAGWQLEKVLATMQVPFPELTNLYLKLFSSVDETLLVIPDSFLDGSAPRLRTVDLSGILFPGLPKLLSSATHLVYLRICNIPHSTHISPEEMVALLSVLPSLETLELEFKSPQSRYDGEDRTLPPSNRFVLLALHHFRFKGAVEYLEDLVTFIDAPQLNYLYITSLVPRRYII